MVNIQYECLHQILEASPRILVTSYKTHQKPPERAARLFRGTESSE